MATENKGVMIYLPKDVEEYIIRYCTEYNITRKDKEGNLLPSLGTGVVTYLKSTISGESPDTILAKPSRVFSNGLTKDEVLDLIQAYNTNLTYSTGLSESPSIGLSKDEVMDLIDSKIPSDVSVDLSQDIAAMQEAVDALTARLDAIEASSTLTPSPAQVNDEVSPNSSSTSPAPQQYTARELIAKLDIKSTQILGKWRDNGKLVSLGYRAEKVNEKNWVYYALDAE